MKADPFTFPASTWQGRRANLASRGVGDDDDRMRECAASLAAWRVRRAVDAERAMLGDDITTAITELLRDAVAGAVSTP